MSKQDSQDHTYGDVLITARRLTGEVRVEFDGESACWDPTHATVAAKVLTDVPEPFLAIEEPAEVARGLRAVAREVNDSE